MIIEIKNITGTAQGDIIHLDIEMSDGIRNSQRVSFKLLASQYIDMRISKGPISESDYDTIAFESDVCEAYLRALGILAFAPNTAHTLKLKLRRRGFGAEVAEQTVKLLSDKGFIDDEAELEREIEHCLRKMWGGRRIISHLYQKGFDDETKARAENVLSEVDFSKNCLRLLMQKCSFLPSDPSELRKVIAFLSRYGYTMSEIRYALSHFGKD